MNPAPGTLLRLLLADDHFVVRSGFAASLELEPDFAVAAEAESGEQAVELFRTAHPDVVLMDVRFPGGLDGIEATAAIRAINPDARVLMYSTFDLGDDIYRALLAGAAGYVLKSAPREEVVAAIRTVAAGERHVQSVVARRLLERIAGGDPDDKAMQVLQLIARGCGNRQIAAALEIAVDAVHRDVARLFTHRRRRDGPRVETGLGGQPVGRAH